MPSEPASTKLGCATHRSGAPKGLEVLPVLEGCTTLAAFATCSHSSSASIAVTACVKWCHSQILTATPAHTEPFTATVTGDVSSIEHVGHP